MPRYETKALDADTWPGFEALVEANDGVWGGCWCLWYHGKAEADAPLEARREAKACRVREGRAHAALVFDGANCVGWCQFGSPDELPRIHNQRAYMKDDPVLPDWRITCFFTGKALRGAGVGEAALAGALAQIVALGGGRVEGYPEDAEGRKASAAFLFNGTVAMFERHGFARDRRIGKHKWVMSRDV